MPKNNTPFPTINKAIQEQVNIETLDPYTVSLLNISQDIINEINYVMQVTSSNLKIEPQEDAEYIEVLLLGLQQKIDKILNSNKISPLEKIKISSELIQKYNIGNCQYKAMLAFTMLIEKLAQSGFISDKHFPSIEIQYLDFEPGHFFILIENNVICDPWAQICYPLDSVNFNQHIFNKKAPIKSFFKIDTNWSCKESFKGTGILEDCQESYNFLLTLLPEKLIQEHKTYCQQYWQHYYQDNYYSDQNFQTFWRANPNNPEEIDISGSMSFDYI